MYTTHSCGYCRMAERLLRQKGAVVEQIHVDDQPQRRDEMVRLSQRRTVPQIFINGRHIGGYMELVELDRRGELDPLLQTPAA